MINLAIQSNSPKPTTLDTPVLPQGSHLRRFTIDEYEAMARTGILTEDDAVELLEGWLVHKTTKNPPHTATTRYTRAALEKYLRPGYFVDSQEPITLSDSEPEPDVFIMGSRFTGLPTWSTHRLKSIPSHLDQCVHPITVASLCIV